MHNDTTFITHNAICHARNYNTLITHPICHSIYHARKTPDNATLHGQLFKSWEHSLATGACVTILIALLDLSQFCTTASSKSVSCHDAGFAATFCHSNFLTFTNSSLMNMPGNAGSTAVGKAVQSSLTEEVGAIMLYSISIFYFIFFLIVLTIKTPASQDLKLTVQLYCPVPALLFVTPRCFRI